MTAQFYCLNYVALIVLYIVLEKKPNFLESIHLFLYPKKNYKLIHFKDFVI